MNVIDDVAAKPIGVRTLLRFRAAGEPIRIGEIAAHVDTFPSVKPVRGKGYVLLECS